MWKIWACELCAECSGFVYMSFHSLASVNNRLPFWIRTATQFQGQRKQVHCIHTLNYVVNREIGWTVFLNFSGEKRISQGHLQPLVVIPILLIKKLNGRSSHIMFSLEFLWRIEIRREDCRLLKKKWQHSNSQDIKHTLWLGKIKCKNITLYYDCLLLFKVVLKYDSFHQNE